MADYSFGFETNTVSPLTTYSSHAAWGTQSTEKNSGTYAAKAGAITDSGMSSMVLAHVADKPRATVTFYKKVSSEEGWDYLDFYIDEVVVGSWSGIDTGFSEESFTIYGAGSHTLRWTYRKDGAASEGSDTAWVDDIEIVEYYPDPQNFYVRTNLVPNPGFEVNTTGWVSENSSLSIARDTSQKLTGTASLKLYNNSGFATGYVYVATPRGTSGIPVQATTDYSLNFSCLAPGTVGLAALEYDGYVSWYNSSGTYLSASGFTYTPGATWQTYRKLVSSPAGAAFATLMFSRYDAGDDSRVNEVCWLDNILLEETGDESYRNYFDGSGSVDGTLPFTTHAWTGTAHQSASIETYDTRKHGDMLPMFF